MVSVVANGASGQLFTYVEPSASTRTIPSISVWAGLALTNPYRREWDSFAALLCVNGQDRSKFALIKNAVERYGQLVMDAASRHLSVSPRAKMQAVEAARASFLAPTESNLLSQLASSDGPLVNSVKSGVASLVRNSTLADYVWGPSLNSVLPNPRTVGSFYTGLAQGAYHGAKDMVIGLATFAGKLVQYGADNSVGPALDNLRSALPNKVQEWASGSELIPSGARGSASTQKMVDTLANVRRYIANHSPAQVGADIAGFIEQHWDSLMASHAAAAAKGPDQEALWWGQVTGRAVFEIAAVVVPVTKLGLAGKLADAAGNLARVGQEAINLTKLVEVTRNAITLAREALMDLRLGAQIAPDLRTTLDSLNRIETRNLPALEARALREAKASIEDALEIAAPSRGRTVGNPTAISYGLGELSAKQKTLLARLKADKDFTTVARAEVSPRDLAALTAATGDEFALFTNGSRRMILRGNPQRVRLKPKQLADLISQGWRWTAHTQPGMSAGHAIASASDQKVLKAFGQEQSMILNSKGDINVFTQSDISYRTPSR